MNALLPAVFGALTVLGIIGAGLALRPYTPAPKAPRVPSPLLPDREGFLREAGLVQAEERDVRALPIVDVLGGEELNHGPIREREDVVRFVVEVSARPLGDLEEAEELAEGPDERPSCVARGQAREDVLEAGIFPRDLIGLHYEGARLSRSVASQDEVDEFPRREESLVRRESRERDPVGVRPGDLLLEAPDLPRREGEDARLRPESPDRDRRTVEVSLEAGARGVDHSDLEGPHGEAAQGRGEAGVAHRVGRRGEGQGGEVRGVAGRDDEDGVEARLGDLDSTRRALGEVDLEGPVGVRLRGHGRAGDGPGHVEDGLKDAGPHEAPRHPVARGIEDGSGDRAGIHRFPRFARRRDVAERFGLAEWAERRAFDAAESAGLRLRGSHESTERAVEISP